MKRERIVKIIGTALCILMYVPIVLLILSSFPARHQRTPCSECAAVANLRTINTAEVTYLSSSDGRYGTMADLIAARLLDDTFNVTKHGYNFSVTLDATGYTATALPASAKHGRYGYYTVADAVIRYMDRRSPGCTPCFPEGQAGEMVQ